MTTAVTFGAKHPDKAIPDQVVRLARPWAHSARAAIFFVCTIGSSEKKIRILLYNLGRLEGLRESRKGDGRRLHDRQLHGRQLYGCQGRRLKTK
jgi:hypothetical protein